MFDTETNSGFIINSANDNIANIFTETLLLHASRNGYSEIYKAKRYGQWFVLKRLTDAERDNPRYKNLLVKEFSIAVTLAHPNIVNTHTLEVVPDLGTCMVQEYVDGWNWSEFFTSNPTDRDEIRRIVSELCDALEYIHSRQLVHRDLKPSNIMITRNGHHVKLIDFGLADQDSYAILKEPAGSLGYASPEQLEGGTIDCRSDLYSLGVLLSDLPCQWHALKRTAKKCLSPSPDDRPASAAVVKYMITKSPKVPGWTLGLAMVVLLAAMWWTASRWKPTQQVAVEQVVPVHDTVLQHDTVVVEKMVEAPRDAATVMMDEFKQLVTKYARRKCEKIETLIVQNNGKRSQQVDRQINALADSCGTYPKQLLLQRMSEDNPDFKYYLSELYSFEYNIYQGYVIRWSQNRNN